MSYWRIQYVVALGNGTRHQFTRRVEARTMYAAMRKAKKLLRAKYPVGVVVEFAAGRAPRKVTGDPCPQPRAH